MTLEREMQPASKLDTLSCYFNHGSYNSGGTASLFIMTGIYFGKSLQMSPIHLGATSETVERHIGIFGKIAVLNLTHVNIKLLHAIANGCIEYRPIPFL